MMRAALLVLSVSLFFGVTGCKNSTADYPAYALTSTGQIIEFQTNKPATIENQVDVNGLTSGQSLIQIAYEGTGTLYGLTSANEICTINPTNGTVQYTSSSAFTATALTDAVMSIDPVADQIRVLAVNANILLVPSTGAEYSVGTIPAYDSGDTNSGSTPQLTSIAYTNGVTGASQTTLYGLDITTHSLVVVGGTDVNTTSTASAGLLHTVGVLGLDFVGSVGLAIDATSNDAFAALSTGSASELYTINLAKGTATLVDTIGASDFTVISLAIPPTT